MRIGFSRSAYGVGFDSDTSLYVADSSTERNYTDSIVQSFTNNPSAETISTRDNNSAGDQNLSYAADSANYSNLDFKLGDSEIAGGQVLTLDGGIQLLVVMEDEIKGTVIDNNAQLVTDYSISLP